MRILILTGLTYYRRTYSLSGIINHQAEMLKKHGHEVGIVVAKGMANKENLSEFTLYEAIDKDNTLENLRKIIPKYDAVFTHDYSWVEYMEWLDKVTNTLEDEFPIPFYHFIHSAPGNQPCPDWQKGRNKPNVTYCYPNEFDRSRVAQYLGLPDNKVITVRLSNGVFEDEELYEKLGLMDADYVGFYPANLMPGKQAHELLKVIKVMVNRGLKVKYVFTANNMEGGDARARLDSYRQLCKDYGIEQSVVWLPDYPEYFGDTDYATVQKIWKITNLFITPSMSETTSLMLLEAVANKCVIVANESLPLNKEILGNGAIYHKFGSYLDNGSNMDDVTLNKLVDFIIQWSRNVPLAQMKRLYSTRHIYKTYYKQLLEPLPSISVVMPIFNKEQETIDLTKRAIKSIGNHEIILINNNKDDATDYGVTKVITNDTNVGVSKAWNQGIREATGDYIMILNSDVELPEGWERQMIGEGIVFPSANEPQGEIVKFAFPWVHGCCFMAKKEIFNRVGPFDERFFAYYEDADYWKRCELAGIKPTRANIVIKHAVNATSGKLNNLGEIIAESEKKFKEKYGIL